MDLWKERYHRQADFNDSVSLREKKKKHEDFHLWSGESYQEEVVKNN